MNKEEIKNALTLVQTVLATSVFSLAIGYMFEHDAYLVLLEILLTLLVLTIAFNNYKYYKLKLITPACVVLALLVTGVLILG